MVQNPRTVAVYCDPNARRHETSILAARLGLPLVESTDDRFDFLLTYTAQRLELRKTGRAAPGPVYVDFVHGSFRYRRTHGGRRQSLLKAVGLRGSTKPSVIDVTAGLGRDAFVLATFGCRVAMLERSPIVHALLADGLARASDDPSLEGVCERLSLYHEDAVSYLTAATAHDKPEVVYLDPMYSHRQHSALNKKEMRLLREVVGDDEDAPQMLSLALSRATRRVVVKRPRLAPALEGRSPDVEIKGATTRYDVYRVLGRVHP